MEKEKEVTKKKHAGHGFKHTHIEHHDDGSHTVRHEHEDGISHKSYAAADLDGVHDGLEDHIGAPNPGEASANAGEAQMAAAAAPAPPAAGA